MKRKILFFTLLVAIVCLLAISASAIEVDGIYYSINTTNLTATVSTENRTSGTLTDVVIPETFEYDSNGDGTKETYVVTEIASEAFGKNGTSSSPVQSIFVPRTVASIGAHAFRGLSYLETVVIEASGYNLETGETSSVTFSNAEFYNTKSLKSVDMSKSNVTKVGGWCFYGCSGLTTVKFSSSIKEISSQAFVNCSSLTTISSLKTVETIGEKAFQGCSSLVGDLELNSLKSISSNAFQGAKITSADLSGAPLTALGSYAFYHCSLMTSITLPSGLESIGAGAFYGCSSLTSIDMPSTVTSIGNEAFIGCSKLASIGSLENVETIGLKAFQSCSAINHAIKLNSLNSIGSNAFQSCSGITGFDMSGAPITSISSYAFHNCSGATSIILPSGLKTINDSAFSGCSGVTSTFVIPDTIESIGGYAFNSCSKASFTLPECTPSIGDYAFQSCTSFTGTVVLKNLTYLGTRGFLNTRISNIIIGGESSFTTIDEYTFAQNTSLVCVVLPSTVTTIKNHAFNGCTSLKYIVASENIETIGTSGVLSSCNNLKSVIITGSDASGFTDSSVFTGWETAPFSEYDPSSATAKTIYYGALKTTDPTVFADFNGFDKTFYAWSTTENQKTAYDAVISALGYSVNPTNTGFGAGYLINHDSLDVYKTLFNKDIKFGIVIFNPKYISGDNFFTNGVLNATSGAIQVEADTTDFSAFGLSIEGFTVDHASLELVSACYVYTENDASDIELIQKQYEGSADNGVLSPMASKVTKTDAVLYTTKLSTITTQVTINHGKNDLDEFVA